MATRGKGEGSIAQRANGTWAATISLGYSQTGKRLRKWIYGKTKKEVTEKLTRIQGQKLDGNICDSGRLTVGDLLDRWLADSVKPKNEPNTYRGYEQSVRLHLKPAIGGVKLSKLAPLHVQSMFSEFIRNGVGARTRQYAYVTLCRALNVALKWELVTRNVCEACDRPRNEPAPVIVPTDDQIGELIRLSRGTRWCALFVLAATGAIREGELFALNKSDADLERATVSVNKSLEEFESRHRIKVPKTKSSIRVVTIPQMAVEALREHFDILKAEGLGAVEILFPDSQGGYLRKNNFYRDWWKYRDAAKIDPAVKFHNLRHASATILLTAGVHPKVVQERLGHSSIKITMDTYSHVMPSLQSEAATKFDHFGFKAKGEVEA